MWQLLEINNKQQFVLLNSIQFNSILFPESSLYIHILWQVIKLLVQIFVN